MVFFTLRLLKFSPPNDRSWKREMYRRLSWHFYGRRRNCYALSRNSVRKSLRFSTLNSNPHKRHVNQIFSYRIAAGCAEHGVQYSSFMKSMQDANILLNKKMLASLAVYEPRSFQSLCEIVKQKHNEDLHQGLASAIKPTPSGVITRDMINKISS